MAGRDLRVNIDADPSGFNRGMKSAEQSAKVFERELAKIEARQHSAQTAMGGIAVGVGVGLVAAFGAAVKVTADFDKAMSGVAAASNASATQLEALRAAALKAGNDTAFSATQAAQAQTELAKVGISTADILGGALKGSLDLAAAGQLDLATAAKVSGQAMTIFSKGGKDVGHIADVLTAGANASSASVESMAESLEQAGLVAAQTGLSLEDTVGTLTAFSKAGLNGSDAGTSLKTMLQRLAAPTSQAAGLMEQLGIHAFDAQGKFVGISAVAGQLKTSLSQLTPEQRQSALATIFGSDAIRAATVLYADGEAGIRSYINVVNDQGAASRQAGKLMDNLSGDLEKLKGSLETALISGGSGATDVLRGLAQGADAAVSAFNSLPGPVQSALTILGGTAGAAAIAGGGLLLLIPKIAETKAAMAALGWTADTTKGKLLGVGKGVAIAVAAFAASEGLGAVSTWLGGTSAGADDLTRSMKRLAETGRFMGDLGDQWGGAFNEGSDAAVRFGEATRETLNPSFWEKYWQHPLSSITSVMPGFTSTITEFAAKFKQVDAVLAQMVSSGNSDQALAAFTHLRQQAKDAGADMSQFASLFPQYNEALRSSAAPAGEAAAATQKVATAAEQAADELQQLEAALKGTFEPSISAYEAQTRLAEAYITAEAAIRKSKGSLNLSSAAAREARGSFAGLLHQVVDTATSQGTLKRSTDAARSSFLQQLPALYKLAGNSSAAQAQVNALAHSFGITGGQAAAARRLADSFRGSINKLRDKSVRLHFEAAQAKTTIFEIINGLGRITSKTIHVSTIYDSPSGRAAILRKNQADGGVMRFYADGGENHVAQVAPAGAWRVWAEPETGGEAYIPLAPAKRNRSTQVLGAVAEQFGYRLERMADGGVLAFADGGAAPLSDFVERFMGGKALSKSDYAKVVRSRADAVDQLRRAERKLADDRKHHRAARTIADDESRVAKERRDLTTATEKLSAASSRYNRSKLKPSARLGAALNLGIKNTSAFITNIGIIADRGFVDLAQALLAMGGADAEKYAADAAKLSTTKLKSLNTKVLTASRSAAKLEQLPNILKIRQAQKGGAKTVTALMRATGLSEDELAEANAVGHLFASGGIMRYASGGWRPGPGVATRPTVLFGEGRGPEAYIPYDAAHRSRAMGLVRQVAGDFGMGGGTTINLTVNGAIDPIGVARAMETALRKLVRTNGRVPLNI